MQQFKPMADRIKPGKIGIAELSVFEVSAQESAFTAMRMAVTGGREQAVPAGRYAKLVVGGELMMTDTPMEQRTNTELISKAKGEVLIAGLGVGMVLEPLLANPLVTSILVVEKFKDVVDLVAPSFQQAIDDERLHIITEDIFKFKPQEDWLWDTIYFDIWPTVCGDNLGEMNRLHTAFKYHLADGGWMSSWEFKVTQRGGPFRRRSFDDEEDGVEFEPEEDDE